MKKNKLLKFVIFSVILIMCLSFFSIAVAKLNVIPSGVKADLPDEQGKTIAGAFIGLLKWIGYIIAIGMVIFIGVKYTMAAADEKANMKGVLVKVVIGALIIVFANTIVNVILSIANSK